MLLWFGLIPLTGYDGRLYYDEGGQSLDGPGMLLIATIVNSIVLFPVLLLILASYLARYRGPGPLWRFRTTSILAILLTVLATLASLFFLWSIFWRVQFWKPTRLPFVAYLLAWAVYFQYLRAAAVNRANPAGVPRAADTFG